MPPRVHAALVLATLSALAACGFAIAFDPAYLQSDSAQYISTAKSVLAGHGPATSIVWTAEHHMIGGVPVAQTNFPPGYPMLIALVALPGLDAARAALGVSVFAFCAVPLLVYWLLRAEGRAIRPALALAAAWFAIPLVWFNVLACLSEVTYTLLTLLALACLRQSERHPALAKAWLLLAGAVAGLAFTVRYAALAFIMTLAAVLLARAARRRDARSLAALALVGAPAAVFVLAISAHNYRLTGRVVGGLLADKGNSLLAVLHSVYWSLSEISGFSKADLVRGGAAEWLLVLFVAGALLWLASGVRLRVGGAAARALARETTALVSLVYVIGSLVFVIAAAKTHASGVVAARYLIPLIPFALLLVPYLAALVRVEAAGRRRTAAAALRWSALVVFLAGQADVAASHRASPHQSRYRYIAGALQQRFGSTTLGEFLSARVTARAPLLGNEAQLMGVALDRPVVGLPGASYTHTVWTEDETRRTVTRYGIAWVLFLPDLLNAAEPDAANQPFFVELKQGRVPSWLAPTFQSNGVRLYQVTQRGA
jgi:4-amino-4-deoxy-L-arabinose transferase-like glycosyltransferase